MNFRSIRSTLWLVLVLLMAIGIPGCSDKKRPNVLFIAVDDLRPELGIYGSRAVTPNIDRLAQSGVKFNHAYCNQAVCGASRISLLTGLYPEFTGERTFHVTHWRERHPDVVTLNQFFKQNGYTTVGLGKIYHKWSGPETDPENWTDYIRPQGVQYADESTIEWGKKIAAEYGKEFKRGPLTEAATSPDAEERYHDGARAAEGVRQIEKLATSGQPFFLAVGFSKPHLPFNAPVKYWELYDPEEFQMPVNKSVPEGYPIFAVNSRPGEMRHYADTPPPSDGKLDKPNPLEFSAELNIRLIHGYHAAVSYMDRNVGELIRALEASGKADNTIIVFWSDHGYKLGDHSSWTKHTNFEVDTRVPLIIVDPRNPLARGGSNALVELIDLYPTLAELCGLTAPVHLQGKSLVPTLNDPALGHRKYAYSSYPHKNGTVMGHSIRNEIYRYTEWWDAESGRILARVASDLSADPGETVNILSKMDQNLVDKFSRDLMDIVNGARGQSE